MARPIIVADTGAPSEVVGVHGGRGILRWKRFVTGLMLHADWDSFEHCRVEPGGVVGDHVHSRTEEIYFIVRGSGVMSYDGEHFEIRPGDLIMTPLNGRHGIANTGEDTLEFIVAEALPPEIVDRLPAYTPAAEEPTPAAEEPTPAAEEPTHD